VTIVGSVVATIMACQLDYFSWMSSTSQHQVALLLNLVYGSGLGCAYLVLLQTLGRRWRLPEAWLHHRVWVGAHGVLALLLLGLASALPAGRTLHAVVFGGWCLVWATAALVVPGWRQLISPKRAGRWFLSALASCAAAYAFAKLASIDNGLCLWSAGLGWVALLVVSLTGWGRLLHRLVLPAVSLDWGLEAAWGMALTVAVGGIANLVWCISPLSVCCWVAAGVATTVLTTRRGMTWSSLWERLLKHPMRVLVAGVIVLLVVVQLVGAVAGTVDTGHQTPPFDPHDDAQAYLVFPMKMLSQGSIGPEPFEARRALNLGGQSLLQTLVIAVLPLRCLHLLDAGVALVLLCSLVLGAGARQRIDDRMIGLILLLVLSLPHLEMRGNTSSLLSGVVLLVALFRTLFDGILEHGGPRATAMVLAVLLGGLCALKSTFIPTVVVLWAVSSMLYLLTTENRRRALTEHVLTAGLVLLLLLPWMISIFESSATMLYPVLGKGFVGGVYTNDYASVTGDFSTPGMAILMACLRQLIPFIPLLVLAVFVRDSPPRFPVLALTGATLVGVVALVLLMGPYFNRSLLRYGTPLLYAGLVSLLLAGGREHRRRVGLGAVVAATVGVVVLLTTGEEAGRLYHRCLTTAAQSLRSTEPVGQRGLREAHALNESLPPTGLILTTVSDPYLLDARVNQLRLMSLPGLSSPPPGLPLAGGAEEVAAYLCAQGIPYLAYGGMRSTLDLLNLTEENIRNRYPRAKLRWVMLRYHQQYREVIKELTTARKLLYVSDTTVVLDLQHPVTRLVPSQVPEQLEGFVGPSWTTGEAIVKAVHAPAAGGYLALHLWGWRPGDNDPDQLGVQVWAGNTPLELVKTAKRVMLFRLDAAAETTTELRVRSRTLPPEQLRARGGVPPLGLDLRWLEMGADPEVLMKPTRTLEQPIHTTSLDPTEVWQRRGFRGGTCWTTGDATLEGIVWPVDQNTRELVVGVRPLLERERHVATDALQLRVFVNDLELPQRHRGQREVRFGLYSGITQINRIRIISSSSLPAHDEGEPYGAPLLKLSLCATPADADGNAT